jgi:hypothetical protein
MKRLYQSIRTVACIMVATLLLIGCDAEKSTAKKLVKDFLKENLVNNDFKVMSFSALDSTKHITDSVFKVMRAEAAQDKAFKKDIQFDEGPKTKKLYYIRIKYRLDNDTCLQTFYLDDQLTRVVSFRNH